MKLKQTSLDQTGIAIILVNSTIRAFPLFSLNPIEEAQGISKCFGNSSVKHVFVTNNLLDYRIEDAIADFREKKQEVLPQNLMDELVIGFPFIEGYNDENCIYFYA